MDDPSEYRCLPFRLASNIKEQMKMKAFSRLGALCAAAILVAFAGMPPLGTTAHAEGILVGISKVASNVVANQAVNVAEPIIDASAQKKGLIIIVSDDSGCFASPEQIAAKLRPIITHKQRAGVTGSSDPQFVGALPIDPYGLVTKMPINIGPVAVSEIASPGGIGRLPEEYDLI